MRPGAAPAAALKSEGRARESLDGRGIQLECAGAFHGRDKCIRHGSDYEDFFFACAKQVVVERRALDDALGCAIQIGRLVNDHRWIARSARYHALAGFGGCLCHRHAAGDAQ